MYSGTTTSCRQTEDQQTEMRSLLGRARRRRSPAPHTADFVLQLSDVAHTSSARGEDDTHIFGILPWAAAIYILIEKGSRVGIRASVSSPTSRIASGNRRTSSPGGSPTSHQRCTQNGQFCKLHVRSSTFGSLLACNSYAGGQLLLPQHPSLLVAPPTVLVECAHLIAEAPFQACFLSVRIRGPVKLEHLPRSISVACWVCL